MAWSHRCPALLTVGWYNGYIGKGRGDKRTSSSYLLKELTSLTVKIVLKPSGYLQSKLFLLNILSFYNILIYTYLRRL